MIPVIDFKSDNLLEQIREAYTTVGFAVFQNPFDDEPQRIMSDWHEVAKEFFNLPLETKLKYPYSGVDTNLGYTGWEKENVDPSAPADMKESYNYSHHFRMIEALWPTEVENFSTLASQSVMLADNLTLTVLSLFEQVLEVPQYTLTHCHIQNHSTTRFIHYPAYDGPIKDGQMRIGEHSDYGTITLLWQINDVPGLEVCDLDGKWHPVPFVKNGVIINIGDLLQRWTNDYFVSTKHRVVNSHIDTPRYSMPHFVDPAPGTIISNLRDEPAKYEPIESLAYLKWRLAQSY